MTTEHYKEDLRKIVDSAHARLDMAFGIINAAIDAGDLVDNALADAIPEKEEVVEAPSVEAAAAEDAEAVPAPEEGVPAEAKERKSVTEEKAA